MEQRIQKAGSRQSGQFGALALRNQSLAIPLDSGRKSYGAGKSSSDSATPTLKLSGTSIVIVFMYYLAECAVKAETMGDLRRP